MIYSAKKLVLEPQRFWTPNSCFLTPKTSTILIFLQNKAVRVSELYARSVDVLFVCFYIYNVTFVGFIRVLSKQTVLGCCFLLLF